MYNERLKQIRKEKHITQEQVAEVLNTSQSYYAKYENGKRALPINLLITLCKFFNVTSDYVLGLSDEYKQLK